jgi:hypothetical protein
MSLDLHEPGANQNHVSSGSNNTMVSVLVNVNKLLTDIKENLPLKQITDFLHAPLNSQQLVKYGRISLFMENLQGWYWSIFLKKINVRQEDAYMINNFILNIVTEHIKSYGMSVEISKSHSP